MESSTSQVFLLVVLIPIAIAFMWLNNTSASDMISNDLRRKGARPTGISREWIDTDRDTMTYLVEYIDSNGNKISSRCKIRHTGFFLDKEIYWFDVANLGASTNFPANHQKGMRIKKNPTLSDLIARKKKLKDSNLHRAGSKTKQKVNNKGKN